jgi:hypothetical protein
MNLVKGSMLMEVVRLIRANKDLNWDKHLTSEEINFADSKILPSNWYPLELYEHMSGAVLMEVGKGDLKNAWTWGRFIVGELVGKTYKNLFQGLDVMAAARKFVFFHRQFFKFDDPNFEPLRLEVLSENEINIHVRTPLTGDRLIEPNSHQTAGSFERLVEFFGGKNPGLEFLEKQWEGAEATVIKVTWE